MSLPVVIFFLFYSQDVFVLRGGLVVRDEEDAMELHTATEIRVASEDALQGLLRDLVRVTKA